MDVSQLRLLSDKLQNRVIKMLGGGQEIGLCSGTPTSKQCCHSKTYALLNDPQIKAELCTYVWSNKWAMDPAKLVEFTGAMLYPSVMFQPNGCLTEARRLQWSPILAATSANLMKKMATTAKMAREHMNKMR